jgi:hypothetical protein
VTAVSPDPNDIALAKPCAWREKDVAWLRSGIGHGVLDLARMRERVERMPPPAPDRGEIRRRLDALAAMP